MQFNFYFLTHLTKSLQHKLNGARLVAAFSQNKNEVVFEFEIKSTLFYIKGTLDGEVSLLSFPDEFARARKNSVDLFPHLLGRTVSTIRQYRNERAFSIQFQEGWHLLFKLHGKRSNILLFEKNQLTTLFKSNLLKDKALNIDSLDRNIDQSDEALTNSDFDLKSIYPTFDKNIKSEINERGFLASDQSGKLEILKGILADMQDETFYLVNAPSNLPQLTLFKPTGDAPSEAFKDAITASNAFARNYLKKYHFINEQKKQLASLNFDINKSKNYIEKNSKKLQELTEGRKYDELANILMANLHMTQPPGSKLIRLFDFYQENEIAIKINEKLSLQKNAENYYRKSKNQKIELNKLKSNIDSKIKTLEDLEAKQLAVLNATNFKELKPIKTTDKKTKQLEVTLPYYQQNIEGYVVYIGKNAKCNDQLTLKIATKNDLWLHAKDVPGSHVIIKSKGNDQYPQSVIEKVARIAAWYSKRKNDTFCPVIYTLKKYVNKPKGAAPGLVKLLREEVVLVKPIRSLDTSYLTDNQ